MPTLVRGLESCPYHCQSGKLFDRSLKTSIPCPHCSERKKELLSRGEVEADDGLIYSLPEILGVSNKFLSTKFVYDSIIPDGERLFIEDETIQAQQERATDLYTSLVDGRQPENSMCFGLGNKGRVDMFVYPMLAKAYLSHLKVARFLSCAEYYHLSLNLSEEVETLLDAEILFVMITDGSNKAEISAAKGLMQSRALKGNATIFVTTWSVEACSMLLGEYGNNSLFYAESCFVRYKGKGGSKYIQNITGLTNEAVDSGNGQGVSMADLL